MKRRVFSFIVAWFSLSLVVLAAPARADVPSVIRIGVPGVGIGNRPVVGGSVAATVHLRGLLEEEFKKDGIQIKWSFLVGAGPALNELFANHLVDFGFGWGDLPSIIGLDDYFTARYRAAVDDSKRLGLIRHPFSVEQWFEPRFLNEALKELGLEHYWQPYDADGKPKGKT